MSAPDTNIEKQKRRHRVPLIGIFAMAIAAVLGLAVLTMVVVDRAEAKSVAEDKRVCSLPV